MGTVFGKALILAGIFLVAIGLIFWLGARFPNIFGFFGNLPGDIKIERENFRFYFPLASSIILSIILSLLLWLITRN